MIASIFSDHNTLKLESNCKKKAGRTTNMWRLKNILLKKNWIKEEIKGDIKRYIETHYWDTKVVIREKFISLQTYLKKLVQSQINNPALYLIELGKEEQMKTSQQKKGNKKKLEQN